MNKQCFAFGVCVVYIVFIQNKLDYFTVFSKLSSSFRVVVDMQLYLKNTDKEKFDVLISSSARYRHK
jgi:hypothetical protein